MKHGTLCLSLLAAAAMMFHGSDTATAQPHGWPCDYGLRLNNVWFYRSLNDSNRIHTETAVREFLDSTGHYWIVIASSEGQAHWLRIDSNCIMDRFGLPMDTTFERWFIGNAAVGTHWTVDSVAGQLPVHARINRINNRTLFGHTVRSKEVTYYPGDIEDAWYQSEEYAPGFGVIRRWQQGNNRQELSGYEELIGAIIDGVGYGYNTDLGITSSHTDRPNHVVVHPLPASAQATLEINARAGDDAAIELHDMLGGLARRERHDELADGVNSIPLDLSHVQPGSYIVVVDVGGRRCTIPMVIVR
ncbi:MAG: hypothetical protein JST22_17880 [Bacteroidetes bacterium]|nr:hypothetical protein [Bacteroidota bacterium]